MNYQERTYREWIKHDDLIVISVAEKETDLLISGDINLKEKSLPLIKQYRHYLRQYIAHNPKFQTSLTPIDVADDAPEIVKKMAKAAQKAGVGPMASVAGAIAEFVGKDLLEFSNQVIVENGGDIFIKSSKERKLGIYAGDSPFTGKMALSIEADQTPLGICTSAGTVGHSLSYGKTDATIILSKSTLLADAVATAAGNIVAKPEDIEKGIEFAKSIDGVEGIIVIVGSAFGAWGNVRMVRA